MEGQLHVVLPVNDGHVSEIRPAEGCQILRGTKFDWNPIIEAVKTLWPEYMGVAKIVDAVLHYLTEDDGPSTYKETGTKLHEYIELFYKHQLRMGGITERIDEFVTSMLRELQGEPRVVEIDFLVRDREDLRQFYSLLWKALQQFYKFASNNRLTVDSVEQPLEPKGIYDALFKISENEYMLVDWTMSARVNPESKSLRRKTLQLNMYKALLEEEGKKIRRMYCVVFHSAMNNYAVFEIEDIGFTIPE